MSGTVELPKTVKGKSGLLTTEFWKSAVVDVLALLTMVGEIKPTGNPKYDSVISAAAGLAAAANNIGYANGRSKAKAAQANATSAIIQTQTIAKTQSTVDAVTPDVDLPPLTDPASVPPDQGDSGNV